MGFATSPFTLEPVRSNEFKKAQISKEIYSLTTHIEGIKQSIALIQTQKAEREKRESEEVAKGRHVVSQEKPASSKVSVVSHSLTRSAKPATTTAPLDFLAASRGLVMT